MKNYSQNQEQQAILNYFNGKVDGTFLDIGANDGQTLSNTRALAEMGWCGVLVEPSPKAFSRLKRLYDSQKKSCFYLYELALGNHNGRVVLHESGELLKQGDTSLVSTIVESEKSRFESVLTYEPVEVKCFRWKTFLNRLTIKKFDFVSIDCEGQDDKILHQMDVTDVRCLCIEFNGNQDLKKAFDAKMQGFRIIYTSAENLIYAR
jgi:FkbM family methyltransferase